MKRAPIREALARIDLLANEIDGHIPAGKPSLAEFRSDLAGLLNVTVCATYENCIKSIIQDYAQRQHALFGIYSENQYGRINSRISVGDLNFYAKKFHPKIHLYFKDELRRIKSYYLNRTSEDIQDAYEQLLEWRHSFAHTGARVTTVEEVMKYHRLGKRVVLIFSDAFSSFPTSN